MADIPITATVGNVTRNGHKIVKVHPASINSPTVVETNPDAGRIVLRAPNGAEYTSVPSIVASTSSFVGTLIKEAQ